MQQREIVVLESIPFQAPSYKGGALISICMSKALILRMALTWFDYSDYATFNSYLWCNLLTH